MKSYFLDHQRSVLYLGWVVFVSFLVCTVMCYIYAGSDRWISIFFLGFSFIGICIIASYYHDSIELNENQILFSSILGKKIVYWDEIICVTYAAHCKEHLRYIVFINNSGEKYKIPNTMRGIVYFLQYLDRKVPDEFYDEGIKTLLDSMKNQT